MQFKGIKMGVVTPLVFVGVGVSALSIPTMKAIFFKEAKEFWGGEHP